jgi:HlyD family secretion protein
MPSTVSRFTAAPLWRTLAHGAVAVAVLGACSKPKEATPMIGTAVVDRRTIVVDAQATGAVEPINVIEVKSKASGQIVKMPVETGAQVREGDLLVQIDTRDVKNQYDQASADLRSAQASLEVAQAQKKRSDELYKTRIITAQEFEAAQLALTQAQGAIVRATTNLDLAKQRLEDATVVAPVSGTVIDKPVSLGQVIASATGSVSGGTTLLKMADLTRVRMRALVNETDIGRVRAGQSARVTVDAYPDRPFQGVVEKIEPQAVVQQSVTMFPVIISLDNNEGYLKPGMNGEVSMLVDRRENVVAVSNDAVRTVREAATAAVLVGLDPDSVAAQVREQQAAMRGNGGAPGGGAGSGSDAPAAQAVAVGEGGAAAAGGQRRRQGDSGAAGAGAAAGASGAGRQGGARSGGAAGGTRNGAAGGNAGAAGGTRMAGRGGQNGGAPGAAGGAMGGGMGGGAPATRARTALVFVQLSAGKFEPRIVRLGASNYDYSEVLSGLKEGDEVATLAVAALQAKRDQQNDRFRSMSGGGVPGMQRGGAAGGGAAPAGGGGGAGAGGGRPPGGAR